MLSLFSLLIFISTSWADPGVGIFWFRDYPISPKRCSTKTQRWMYNIETQIQANKAKSESYLSHRMDMENKKYYDLNSLDNYAFYLDRYISNANNYKQQLLTKYNELLNKGQSDEYRDCMQELMRLVEDASINQSYFAWGLKNITNFKDITNQRRNCIGIQE